MAAFATFRSRLIVLFALATFPAVALALALSWRVYDNAKEASERAYLQAAQQVAMQERAVIESALRVMRTILAASADDMRDGRCGDLTRVVDATRNYSAIALIGAPGVLCAGGRTDTFNGFQMDALLAPLAKAESAIDYAVNLSRAASRPLIAVSLPTNARDTVIAVVIDSGFLESVLSEIAVIDRGSVAIVEPSTGLVVANGNAERREDWLPSGAAVLASTATTMTMTDASRAKRDFIYAVQSIHEGSLTVIAGFPATRFGPAERQLAIGLIFPFVLFAIVLAVAWIAIDRLFLQWVGRLDATARRLAFGDFSVRAGLPSEAPLELRQYAHAFDQMTEVLGTRTRELATVAQQRSHLLRELHHRVKNNFQVIASFLNLMKRERTGETREALALAESRVHAMAAAYKLALAQGDIRLVSVPVLIEDVVSYVQHAADMPRAGVRLSIEPLVAFLDLDRAIPLALVLVETLWPLVTHTSRPGDIAVAASRDGAKLVFTIMGPRDAPERPVGRFRHAFLSQLEATDIADPPPGAVLAVTIPIDPGPQSVSETTEGGR